ncbi:MULTISPECIES: YcgN family cysteine cluster protein [Alteromonadaceae]|uniref:YcgN family cysteine cluster protein n=1 Tax=Alteromonadaceae TaxID=72275 RepID=UPI001C0A3182|nr:MULTISPECIES: YcgN family cysteine cluster protein [Aliiglaciecola]MBU2880075.1 YcgN family cysteine cluster protein [Aliiglaciecola lipolytica]MDO6710927.1 YcgN family cysteine cluster protein [Aliiglaciecola sp. 2_MG-2023]MDO6752408.1 YcgN family cysteine cluster protein [Aliiglaciecola sp. 1_MG-2023]
MSLEANFWQTKSLKQMNRQEWEAICDGCAKCCLHKIIDEDASQTDGQQAATEELHFTNVVCSFLNTKTCACTQYADRDELVPECVTLSQDNLHQLAYMPPSCSYRRLNEGKGLPSWHPLLHKNKKSEMHKAGMSVRGKTVFDRDVDESKFEDHIVIWPLNEID